MGVLTENPPSGGLLADLLARLMANHVDPKGPGAYGDPVNAISAAARADLQKYVDQQPDVRGSGAYGNPVQAINPQAAQNLRSMTNQEPLMMRPGDGGPMGPPPMQQPTMPSMPPPGAAPAPVLAQQGPMGGLMSAPRVPGSLPIPMQKPSQPIQTAALAGRPILSPGFGRKKQAAAPKGLSDADLLNLQQLFPNMNRQQIAALWARRQAAG